VQEALNNVIKHADASRARIAVEQRDGTITVTVEDDGRGIDGGEPGGGEPGGGFGLVGMRERVELVDGELEIGPGASGGTRVTARLPVRHRRAEAG
jgi:signal transduction histidine kinase